MTGPEHYKAAENCVNATIREGADVDKLLAEAQVHATLALAAATAMSVRSENGMVSANHQAWDDVCGERR